MELNEKERKLIEEYRRTRPTNVDEDEYDTLFLYVHTPSLDDSHYRRYCLELIVELMDRLQSGIADLTP